MTTTSPGEPVLSITGLSKRFGAVQALKDIDFDVRPGEVVALVGDNGAGKSSLFAAVRHEIEPDQGDIDLPGKVRIASVAQETPSLPDAAIDFVLAGLGARRSNRWVRFMAKKSIWQHKVAGFFMRGLKHIPVDRHAGGAAFKEAVAKLKDGEVVGVYPEATMSRSFEIKELKSGTARMAQELRETGTYDAMGTNFYGFGEAERLFARS